MTAPLGLNDPCPNSLPVAFQGLRRLPALPTLAKDAAATLVPVPGSQRAQRPAVRSAGRPSVQPSQVCASGRSGGRDWLSPGPARSSALLVSGKLRGSRR